LMKMRGIPAARHSVSSILGRPRGGPFFFCYLVRHEKAPRSHPAPLGRLRPAGTSPF